MLSQEDKAFQVLVEVCPIHSPMVTTFEKLPEKENADPSQQNKFGLQGCYSGLNLSDKEEFRGLQGVPSQSDIHLHPEKLAEVAQVSNRTPVQVFRHI